MAFTKAVKRKQKLRIGIVGPSGTGKTWTALAIACEIARDAGGRVAVIDTENGSAALYSDTFDFDVMELHTFAPDTYVAAIGEAASAGYAVVVVDSLSHAWMGKEGAMEQLDKHAAKERGNSFGAWRHVTPMHNRLIDALTRAPIHVVATMRAKTEYVIEEEKGRKTPRKIGMAPVQRDGMEYEFTVVGDMDYDHRLIVTKSRCSALADAVIEKPDGAVARTLLTWLEDAQDAEDVEPLRSAIMELTESLVDPSVTLTAAQNKVVKFARELAGDAGTPAERLTAARDAVVKLRKEIGMPDKLAEQPSLLGGV